MADLDQLEQKVNALDENTSSIFSFKSAIRDIEAAAGTVTDQNVSRLRTILKTYRLKLPDLPNFSRIETDARDLADNLMLATLAKRIARIGARNEALASLTGDLQTQIGKANKDANLLKQIKSGVDKATKTVDEAKSLVDQLTVTNTSTKNKLKALIQSLANVSSVFEPQED